MYKNKGTSLWNFFLNSRTRKFRHGISIERVINLDRERWRRSQRDKLDRRWSTNACAPLAGKSARILADEISQTPADFPATSTGKPDDIY